VLLQHWKDFVSEESMELFVLVSSDIKANAARDLSLVGIGVVVDVLHLRISPAPRLFSRPCVRGFTAGRPAPKRSNSGAHSVSNRMTEYTPFSVVNVDFTTIYAKSRRRQRLPDEVDFGDAPESVLTLKKSL
jgi:hypothetical protein